MSSAAKCPAHQEWRVPPCVLLHTPQLLESVRGEAHDFELQHARLLHAHFPRSTLPTIHLPNSLAHHAYASFDLRPRTTGECDLLSADLQYSR